MITRIKIDGFKSFSNFEVELKPFNVIVGANGSGKSNLLDALQLLRDLSQYSIAEAFSKQRGTPSELFNRYPDGTTAQEMSFEVDVFYINHYDVDKKNQFRLSYTFTLGWINNSDIEKISLKKESIALIEPEIDDWLLNNIAPEQKTLWLNDLYKKASTLTLDNTRQYDELVIKRGGYYSFDESANFPVLKFEILPIMFGTAIKQLKFLDLDLKNLRQPSEKGNDGKLKENGLNLPGVLHRIAKEDKRLLKHFSRSLYGMLSNYKGIRVKHDESQDNYYVELQSNDDTWFNARLLSEGTLKMVAVALLKFDETHQGTLCIEEPENGVHPSRIQAILETLLQTSTNFSREPWEDEQLKQVIVTSHSPVLLSKALKLEGKIGLFYAQLVTAVNCIPNQSLNITRIHTIHKRETSKYTLNLGDRHIYAKQIVDYFESVNS